MQNVLEKGEAPRDIHFSAEVYYRRGCQDFDEAKVDFFIEEAVVKLLLGECKSLGSFSGDNVALFTVYQHWQMLRQRLYEKVTLRAIRKKKCYFLSHS